MLSGSSSDDGSSREEQKIAKVEGWRKTNTIWQQCTCDLIDMETNTDDEQKVLVKFVGNSDIQSTPFNSSRFRFDHK